MKHCTTIELKYQPAGRAVKDSSITPPTSQILLFHQDSLLLPQIPSRCVASTQPGDHMAFDGGFVHAVCLDFQNGVAQTGGLGAWSRCTWS